MLFGFFVLFFEFHSYRYGSWYFFVRGPPHSLTGKLKPAACWTRHDSVACWSLVGVWTKQCDCVCFLSLALCWMGYETRTNSVWWHDSATAPFLACSGSNTRSWFFVVDFFTMGRYRFTICFFFFLVFLLRGNVNWVAVFIQRQQILWPRLVWLMLQSC